MTSAELAAEISKLENLVRIHVGKLAAISFGVYVEGDDRQIVGMTISEGQHILYVGTIEEVVRQITSQPRVDQ